MTTSIFELIREDFVGEIDTIRQLVGTFDGPGKTAKARIAAANSATLLVAATFEEFVREMAREHARVVVTTSPSFDKLPKKLVSTAWKRSMEGLARVRLDVEQSARESLMVDTHARFSVAYSFAKGDLTQDIYRDLIHNENNMRPNELNSMFNVAGLSDMCQRSATSRRCLILRRDRIRQGASKVARGSREFLCEAKRHRACTEPRPVKRRRADHNRSRHAGGV